MTALLLTRELSDLQDVIANNIRGYRSRDDLKKKKSHFKNGYTFLTLTGKVDLLEMLQPASLSG